MEAEPRKRARVWGSPWQPAASTWAKRALPRRSRIPGASTLRPRIGHNHLAGKVRNSSTLRRTLAAVLVAPLALVLVGPKRLEAASEAELSDWMRRHLSVAVYGADSGEHRAELEKRVVEVLLPPLNLERMPPDKLPARLLDLRALVIHAA